MAITSDIVATYRHPRRVMRRLLDRGVSEGQALAINIGACFVIFVAQWPRLSREAHLNPEIPLDARLGGALMGVMIIAPLLFYGIAAVSHLIAKLFGGEGDWLGARIAFFWALLSTGPMWLLQGIGAGFIGTGVQLNIVGALLIAVFFYIWFNTLREAEQAPAPSAA